MSFYAADNATIRGNVTIGEDSGIWFGAVVRAERATITIGNRTNIQDNCVVHVDKGAKVVIGDDVTVGHGAIVHGCTVGSNTLIGMGAIILNNAVIGSNCVIGAGALVTEGKAIPDNSLVMGVPGKVVRELTAEDVAHVTENARMYVEEAKENLTERTGL